MGNYQSQGSGMHYQSIYEYSTEQKHELGYRLELADGRVFRYASTAVNVPACNIVQSAIAITNALHRNRTGVAYGVGTTKLTFTVGATAVVQNFYRGGMFLVVDNTAAITQVANYYRIGGNTACDASGTPTIYLDDPLVVATTTSSLFSLYANPYSRVILPVKTTISGMIMGLAPIAVPAATAAVPLYFWLQTWGLAAAEKGLPTTMAAGSPLIPEVTTITKTLVLGAVGSVKKVGTVGTTTGVKQTANEQVIGYALDSVVTLASWSMTGSKRYFPCFLKIAR